jgi:transglycosylase-like protein
LTPNTDFEFPRTRLLPVLLIVVGALLAFGAQSALAGSGGMGPGGTSPSTPPDDGGTSGADANLTPAKYARLWQKVPSTEKRWARDVSECESGHDPDAVALGGDYRGAFMFTPDAWETSPKSPGGDPIDYSYKTQAVVAVALKKRDGTGPWPVCG